MNTSGLHLYLVDEKLPLPTVMRVDHSVPAGFPSPAGDYLEDRIDLGHELIRNPTATFMARVRGDSMQDAGLCDGDLILIDRSRTARSGSMVLAWVDGGFTVKHLHIHSGKCVLRAANPEYPDIEFHEEDDSRIWGVVTYLIHSCTGTP